MGEVIILQFVACSSKDMKHLLKSLDVDRVLGGASALVGASTAARLLQCCNDGRPDVQCLVLQPNRCRPQIPRGRQHREAPSC